jgi:hypothetical protein
VIGDRPIIWSCHTDTVHRKQGRQNIWQRGDVLRLPDGTKSNCLGADDTVGMWLMLSMIAAGVSGRYVFHYGEERGGIGSRGLNRSEKWKETLKGYKACIALDRAGFSDVITHQAGGRCCSDAFAKSLGNALNLVGPFLFVPSSGGVYTDSAEYTDAIGECTNISVGYFGQHSPIETADLGFAHDLRDALCSVDWDTALVFERKPGEYDVSDWGDMAWGRWEFGGHYGGKYGAKSYRTTISQERKENQRLLSALGSDELEPDETETEMDWRAAFAEAFPDDDPADDPRGCPFCGGDGCYCCADFSIVTKDESGGA